MKILMIAPEMAPFAKVGGLADVLEALPKGLAKRNHEVRVFMPLYKGIAVQKEWKAYENVQVNLGGHKRFCTIWECESDGVKICFVEYKEFFDRPGIYEENGQAYHDNGARFVFLNRAALDWCLIFNWTPDVIHCHDWTTGLTPVYLNTVDSYGPLSKCATVFTIHNLEHQGIFDKGLLEFAGLPFSEFRSDSLESMGAINCMKGGIYHSTKITTVSPTYAKEIQTPEQGFGLNHILKFKSADLVGILNGVNTDSWSPQQDKLIAANYNVDSLGKKLRCKNDLQKTMYLLQDENVPVFGVVSRLYSQKGLDVLAEIVPSVLDKMKVQFAILGSGEHYLESRFIELANAYPGRMGVKIGYDNALSHKIEAGADFFLMPSRFEPCGLNQIYSMLYGTLPIVRRTGGLADTVRQYEEGSGKGTGFIFDELNSSSLFNTIGWACSTYYDRFDECQALQKNAMSQDFSWGNSVKKYEEVYYWAVEEKSI